MVLELCCQHGESDPKALVLRLCRELLDECPTERGPSPLPVLASLQGIREIHYEPIALEAGCSGYIVQIDGGYSVTIDSREPTGRQVLSVGHEIVHPVFLNAGRRGPASAEEELLCDIGATELAMPEDRFQRYLASVGVSLAGIGHCQSEFGTSFEACARRAIEVCDEPACFLVAKVKRTKAQEQWRRGTARLRVDHWTASQSWPHDVCYMGVAFQPECIISEAFEHQEERAGVGRLGTNFHDGVFDIEAVGYSYSRNGNDHQQVCALLRLV